MPLALAQAAAVITGQRITYPHDLARMRALPAEQYLAHTEEDPYPHAVPAAILLSLDAARTSDTTGIANALINLASLLSPQECPAHYCIPPL